MFRIPSMSKGSLLKYGLLAFASQHLFRMGMERYQASRNGARSAASSKQKRMNAEMKNNSVDTASQDSFPASDPPSYTSGTVGPLPS